MRTNQQIRSDSKAAIARPIRSRNPKRPSIYRGAVRTNWVNKEAEHLHNNLHYRWTITVNGTPTHMTGDFTTYQQHLAKPNKYSWEI